LPDTSGLRFKISKFKILQGCIFAENDEVSVEIKYSIFSLVPPQLESAIANKMTDSTL
jgi:hypothetical protein